MIALNRLNDFPVILEVFPEEYLVPIDEHLIFWAMELATKLGQRQVLLLVLSLWIGAALGILLNLQVVDVFEGNALISDAGDASEVDLVIVQEYSLILTLLDVNLAARLGLTKHRSRQKNQSSNDKNCDD